MKIELEGTELVLLNTYTMSINKICSAIPGYKGCTAMKVLNDLCNDKNAIKYDDYDAFHCYKWWGSIHQNKEKGVAIEINTNVTELALTSMNSAMHESADAISIAISTYFTAVKKASLLLSSRYKGLISNFIKKAKDLKGEE